MNPFVPIFVFGLFFLLLGNFYQTKQLVWFIVRFVFCIMIILPMMIALCLAWVFGEENAIHSVWKEILDKVWYDIDVDK